MILPTNTDIARQRRDDMVAAATHSRLVRDARAARRAASTDGTTARRSPLQRLLTSLRPRPVVAPAPTERPVATTSAAAAEATPGPEPVATTDRSADDLVGCGTSSAA